MIEGATVAFACRPWPGNVNQEVVQNGHELLELTGLGERPGLGQADAQIDWLGTRPEQDASETETLATRWGGVDILVVDHYGIDSRWEKPVRSAFERIVVIDDLADRVHECDVLTDPTPLSFAAERYSRCVDSGTRLLLGARFALLRPDFARRHADQVHRDGRIRRILVAFGGVDIEGYSLRAIGAVRQALGPEIVIDVVVGSGCPHLGELEKLAEHDRNLRMRTDCKDVGALIASADLGVGAGGTMAWERACLGLPAIVAPIAANQLQVTRALGLSLCALEVPPGPSFGSAVVSVLATLAGQAALVCMLGANAAQLVDGRGAVRLARRILEAPIALRRATLVDSMPIWEWRNDPDVRRVSRNTEEIQRDTHELWFRSALQDPDVVILIADSKGRPVAVLRFDIRGSTAEVSIYLTPGNQGRGFGATVLRQCEQWLAMEKPKVKRLVAEVRTGNAASSGAFEAAGYCVDRLIYEREVGDGPGR